MPTQAMPFFAVAGAFAHADKQIDNQPYPVLKLRCENSSTAGKDAEAILYAEKAIILYGIPGVMLYLPVQLKILRAEKDDGEIIDQALIATLSIVLFAKRYIQETEQEERKELQSLELLQTQLLSLTDSAETIKIEAEFLSAHYYQSSKTDVQQTPTRR